MRAALAAAAAIGLAACATPEPPSPPVRPNVVLLVIDALRGDRLGFAGYDRPTSPNLDALAGDAIWFRNAFSQATWTKPSVGSLLTSRYPRELGLVDLDLQEDPGVTTVLSADLPVLPQAFQQSGWLTGAVIDQPQLKAVTGFARGFDEFRHLSGRNAFRINQIFASFLEGTGDRRFFAYIHYLDVHWPYDEIPKGIGDEFGPLEFEFPPPHDLKGFESWHAQHFDARSLASLSNRYDAGVRWTDEAVGELVGILKSADRWANTILVITADHGEGFNEHGQLMHGFAPWLEVSHVPLLLHVPSAWHFPPGERVTPAGLLDVFPTLLDLAGLPAEATARGSSLRPVLDGREDPSRIVVTQAREGWSLRDGRFSLVALGDGPPEFFDRSRDPREQDGLAAAACSPRCEEMLGTLRRLRATVGRAVAPRQPRDLTPSEIDELRSLGYL